MSAADDGKQVIVNLDSAAISPLNSVISDDSDCDGNHDWAAGGSVSPNEVPEPASAALFGSGLAA